MFEICGSASLISIKLQFLALVCSIEKKIRFSSWESVASVLIANTNEYLDSLSKLFFQWIALNYLHYMHYMHYLLHALWYSSVKLLMTSFIFTLH